MFLFSSHIVCSSAGYLSPEVLANLLFKPEMYDGMKIDVWALGALLCRMMSGHTPFYFDEVRPYI